jgi:hypothetical protein
MTMQLNNLTAREGIFWLRQGFWLFKKQPLAWLMLLFIYMLVVQSLALFVPIIGVLFVLFLTPGLFVGFMTAGRRIILGQRILPTVLLAGFREYGPNVRNNLFRLGLIYTGLVLLGSLLASMMVDFEGLAPVVLKQEPMTAEAITQLRIAVLWGGVFYIPVAGLLWFSPLLVAWHNIPPVKALFFSWMACWKNKKTFAVYFALSAILCVAVPTIAENILTEMGAGIVSQFLLMPYSMVSLATLFCSFYATWKGCFNIKTPEDSNKFSADV